MTHTESAAQGAYAINQQRIATALAELTSAVLAGAKRSRDARLDWGHVGSLAHVASVIEEAARTAKGHA
jgi:hypothetical protein